MSIDKQLEEIVELLKKMNESLDDIKKQPQIHINIQQADIHDPVIDNMTFSLDALDIKDLSGALNLGNNFGVKVNKEEKASKKAKTKEKNTKKEAKKIVKDLKDSKVPKKKLDSYIGKDNKLEEKVKMDLEKILEKNDHIITEKIKKDLENILEENEEI